MIAMRFKHTPAARHSNMVISISFSPLIPARKTRRVDVFWFINRVARWAHHRSDVKRRIALGARVVIVRRLALYAYFTSHEIFTPFRVDRAYSSA